MAVTVIYVQHLLDSGRTKSSSTCEDVQISVQASQLHVLLDLVTMYSYEAYTLISQDVLVFMVLRIQIPHKIVNLLFTVANLNNMLTILWGG